ncbi:MAG TPA: SUMF1/EgtB/PvdO family nonheme iron enzyme [Ktedonobacterales bacterium]|jgi:formylglycine-generating enzyme required for sulfatase activity
MGKIFISYRRDDSAADSGRIDDRLAPKYGRANVFKDVDNIPLGVDFRRALNDEVAKCDVMLVIIGRQWVTMSDEHRQQRLDNPSDFVRIEVEAALARNIPVIPVLVQNAAMPQERDLPASLAPLAYRNGIGVRGDPYFHQDMDLLIRRLDALFAPAPAQSSQPAPAQMLPQQPTDPQQISMPADRLPARLSQLGFTAYRALDGAEYIAPPLCNVPAGAFLMGSDKRTDSQAYDDELPQQSVTLAAFQVGKYPVTVAEYACFVRAGQKEPTNWQQQLGKLDHPVVYVSWQDAVAYAQWLAAQTGQPWRLPSEAEWEKAARGTDGRIYPWGDTFDASCCNTSEGGKRTTTPVGSYPSGASPYGAQEMSGNVRGWTSSVYKPYPYTASDGRERAESTESRVLRGGSWYSLAGGARGLPPQQPTRRPQRQQRVPGGSRGPHLITRLLLDSDFFCCCDGDGLM